MEDSEQSKEIRQAEKGENTESAEALPLGTEARFRAILDAIPDLIFILDNKGRFIDFSPSASLEPLVPSESFLNKTIVSVMPPDVAPTIERNLQRAFQTRQAQSFEYELIIDGSQRFFESRIMPIDDRQAVAVSREITERKSAEQNAELQAAILQNVAEGVCLIREADGRIVYSNPTFDQMFGYDSGDLIGQNVSIVNAPTDQSPEEIAQSVMTSLKRDGTWRGEIHNVRKDGTTFWCHANVSTFDHAEFGEVWVAVHEDITARKLAVEALETSEGKYSRLVETAHDLIWQCDTEGRFTYLNPAWEKTHGYQLEEMLGRPFTDFEPPQVVSQELEVFQSHLEGGESRGHETVHLTKSGERISLIFNAVPTRDHQGNIIGTHGTAIDITDRKKMEQELLKVEKLESIGVLAGGIAHDLNNFLMGVVGNISMAILAKEPARKNELLELAEEGAIRIEGLTQQLLTFSKGGMPRTAPHDLGNLLQKAVDFALSGSNLHCAYDLADAPYSVDVDEGQIRQVINNFVINAKQAMPAGGKIKVSATHRLLDNDSGIPLQPGPYVQVSIEDHGIGIPQEIRQHIFDPFFSTKPTGSGLGLATSHSIIQNHSGHISMESEVGSGTRFDIYLPASQKVPSHNHEESALVKGQGRILVMDDDETIRDVAARSLKELGYDVVTCGDGAEAKQKYQRAMQSGSGFNLVILDLTVPDGMGGTEAIKDLIELDPSVRAIIASGYSNDSAITHFADYGFKAAIAKPYRLSELSQVIHAVLSEAHLNTT